MSERVTLHHGDCLEVLRTLPDASVDAVVTDPPYGLGFMGKDWDTIAQEASRPPSADATDERFAGKFPRTGKGPAAVAFDGRAFQDWCEQWATECLRVLKPGGHMLAFGGTRTWHRLAVAVEDAGFEVRDSLAWLYGSGFPKSLDVSKAIDKAAGAEREVVGYRETAGYPDGGTAVYRNRTVTATIGAVGVPATAPAITAPATPDAERWQGWGTALKPAFEPIVVARKPIVGTVAANVLAHGTGALNVDGCRIAHANAADLAESTSKNQHATFGTQPGGNAVYGDYSTTPVKDYDGSSGRWPANVILDEDQAGALDRQSGNRPGFSTQRDLAARAGTDGTTIYGKGINALDTGVREGYNDSGGASRFFYTAKAGADERVRVDGVAHPTVKPLGLMRWLVRLVTPPDGVVLEPFAGSGTTVEACLLEGLQCIAIEREADYLPLIHMRIMRQTDYAGYARANGEDLGLLDLTDQEAST